MKLTRNWFVAGLVYWLMVSLLTAGTYHDLPDNAVESITARELQPMLEFLASEEMGGRAINSAGNRLAARFIAYQFEDMGLEPAGDIDSFFQNVPLLQARLGGSNFLSIRRHSSHQEKKADLRRDFLPSPLSANGKVSADLVFAGYGITAPEWDYDDYSNISVRGKIVVLLGGEPQSEADPQAFDGSATTKYSAERYKIQNALVQGATGVLLIPDSVRLKNLERAARFLYPEDISRSRLNPAPYINEVTFPVFYVKAEFLEDFLGQEISSIKESINTDLKPRSRPLDLTVSMQSDLDRKETAIQNVIAVIEGNDPVLKNECVMVSAHYDHIGERGDKIFFGADDDASGIVSVLEIAEAFVESGIRPRRTIIFALWDGEERGLLGSRYYASQPLFPLQDTVALLQLDMIGRNQEVTSTRDRRFGGLPLQTAEENANTLHVIGHSKSPELKRVIESANRTIGLELLYEMDQHRLGLIRRSDHWPFLTAGVPAFLLTTGLHPDYHTENDIPERINYPKLERVARLAFLTVWQLANGENRPQMKAR